MAPPEVRMPGDLVAIIRTLAPVQLATALSLLHPADPHLCAARAAIDVADLRHGALRARTEISHEVASAVLAVGLRTEPIRPVQIPRVPVRCDVCSRAGAVLQPMRGQWVWTPEEIAA